MSETSNIAKRNRFMLVALFAAPIVFSYLAFKSNAIESMGTKNFGYLIIPARPVEDLELTSFDNRTIRLGDFRKTWLMLYINSGECGDNCKLQLSKIRQSRLAQGGEYKRIKRMYVMFDRQSATFFGEAKKIQAGLEMATVTNAQKQNLLERFVFDNKGLTGNANRIYLIDPVGNLMMSYDFDKGAAEIARDLKRLLYVSQVG